jgi:NAD(P)-dependent dehydrogenase (short-subunit alcohol dehydrogenase family)
VLEGRVAIVTGGTGRIGRAIVARLRAAGATVVPVSRRTGTDVRDETSVRAMVRDVLRRHKRIDILVNNAGVMVYGRVERMSLRDWARTIETNLTGAFLCSRAVFPHLKRRGGEIVMMSSVYGKDSSADCGAYSASKYGLMGLARALLEEGLPHGIRVSCVCPGRVREGGDAIPPAAIAETVFQLVTLHPNAVVHEVRVDRKGALIV